MGLVHASALIIVRVFILTPKGQLDRAYQTMMWAAKILLSKMETFTSVRNAKTGLLATYD